MATLFVFVLLFITICLLLFRYQKTSQISGITTIVCFFIIGSGMLTPLLLNNLEFPYLTTKLPIWGKDNAIVVLGGGAVYVPIADSIKPLYMSYSRIPKAAQLYFSCKKTGNKCTLVISGGDALHTGKPEANVYQDELLAMGVSKKDVILEANSMNTYKNAEFTSRILKSKQFDKMFLVTSGIHMKRALLYFSNFGMSFVPEIADYIRPKIFPIPLGYNFAITDYTIHEYAGIMRFYIYNYLGWNTEVSKSGQA